MSMTPAEQTRRLVLDAYRTTWARRGARTHRAVFVREGGRVTHAAAGYGVMNFDTGSSTSVVSTEAGDGVEIRKIGFKTYQRHFGSAVSAPGRWSLVDLGGFSRRDTGPRSYVAMLEAALVQARGHGRHGSGPTTNDIFVVTVDLGVMEEQAGLRGTLRQAFEGTDLHRFVLKVDTSGLVVSETSVLAGPTDDGLDCFGQGSTSTLELLEFDIATDVPEPPSTEVDDVTKEVMSGLLAPPA